jgi:hypothetical protein
MKLWTDLLCRLVEKINKKYETGDRKEHKIKRDKEKMAEIEKIQRLNLHPR